MHQEILSLFSHLSSFHQQIRKKLYKTGKKEEEKIVMLPGKLKIGPKIYHCNKKKNYTIIVFKKINCNLFQSIKKKKKNPSLL